MATNIPPETAVPMKFAYPPTCTQWDGPPTWTTSDPDHSVVALTSADQTEATVTVVAGATGVTVTVGCPFCTATSDSFDAQDGATAPSSPIELTGAKT